MNTELAKKPPVVVVILAENEYQRSDAQVLSGHSAVIWLENVSGCYLLDRVTPAPTFEFSGFARFLRGVRWND